jgi:hypothetical protein
MTLLTGRAAALRYYGLLVKLEDEPDRQRVHGHAEDIGPVDQVQVQAGRGARCSGRCVITAARCGPVARTSPGPSLGTNLKDAHPLDFATRHGKSPRRRRRSDSHGQLAPLPDAWTGPETGTSTP